MNNTNIYNFPTDLDDEKSMLPEPDPELLIALGKINYWWNEVFKYERLNEFDNWKVAVKEWQSSQQKFKSIAKKHNHVSHFDIKKRLGNMSCSK